MGHRRDRRSLLRRRLPARELISEVAAACPQKHVIPSDDVQLGTYDGTIYNARQVVDKIGRLCDYILFIFRFGSAMNNLFR